MCGGLWWWFRVGGVVRYGCGLCWGVDFGGVVCWCVFWGCWCWGLVGGALGVGVGGGCVGCGRWVWGVAGGFWWGMGVGGGRGLGWGRGGVAVGGWDGVVGSGGERFRPSPLEHRRRPMGTQDHGWNWAAAWNVVEPHSRWRGSCGRLTCWGSSRGAIRW